MMLTDVTGQFFSLHFYMFPVLFVFLFHLGFFCFLNFFGYLFRHKNKKFASHMAKRWI